MVKLLLYAYCMGKPSSRQIEQATYEEVPYRVLAADQHPDHDTLAAFRQQHGDAAALPPRPDDGTVTGAMRAKLQSTAGHAAYALRKAIVEPVFGQVKAGRGFRRFSLRGLSKVQAEWQVICLTHNPLKLFRAGWTPQAA